MNITSSEITPLSVSIDPILNNWIRLEFDSYIEIPISISGKLCHKNGKIISILSEHQINTNKSYKLKFEEYNDRNKSRQDIQLFSFLTHRAIQSIEEEREKHVNKSVEFYIEYVIKTFGFDNMKSLEYRIEKISKSIEIKQSVWVQNFSSILGIGNYILLELEIPDNIEVSEYWNDLYKRLVHRVSKMKEAITVGDWSITISESRQFYDIINSKNKNQTQYVEFKHEFSKLFEKDGHSDEGINNFFDAIKNFFDFNSKYIHDRDRNGNLNPYLMAKKEDAYFIYTLSIGLLNLIGKKFINL